MSFPEALERMDDAVFRRFGEDATYCSHYGQVIEGVRVIPSRPDDMVRFGDSQVITPTSALRFRRREVAAPERGDRFVLIEGGAEVEFVLNGDPTLNRRRTVWSCGADVLDVSR